MQLSGPSSATHVLGRPITARPRLCSFLLYRLPPDRKAGHAILQRHDNDTNSQCKHLRICRGRSLSENSFMSFQRRPAKLDLYAMPVASNGALDAFLSLTLVVPLQNYLRLARP
jgi:hypothetical protein